MGKSFKRTAPLWITYLVLFGLSALGPILGAETKVYPFSLLFSDADAMNRGHWVFLFLMPFSIGCIPLGFILGEVLQHRTRASGRVAWRWGVFHALVMYAVFMVGIYDMLLQATDILYYVVWIAPAFASGLFFVVGMVVMRIEQAHSDARYGVEVSRGDPWASFFDLQWEDDTPRKVTARSEVERKKRPRKGLLRRRRPEGEFDEEPTPYDEAIR